MDFKEKILLHSLQLKASMEAPAALIDSMIDSGQIDLPLRQMCAKVPVELHDRLDQLCSMLNMSKRDFIQAAVSDALVRASDIIQESGVLDAIDAAAAEAR